MRDRRWFVVQTNIKCEDKAARNLRAEGYKVYWPKMRKEIVHHRTKKRLRRHFKLFNRYIFVGIRPDNMDFWTLRRCEGVEKVLGTDIDGRPHEIAIGMIERFLLSQRRGEFDDIPQPSRKDTSLKRFPVGTSIRIKTDRFGAGHPFGGFYGQVVGIKGRGVVKAMIELFGRLVPVDVEPDFIDPVDRGTKAA